MEKYVMTDWVDHIVDPETNEIIQQGTRFTAIRANNLEKGVYNLYGGQTVQEAEIRRLKVQIEMIGRTPTNNGVFFDTLSVEVPKNLEFQTQKAITQSAVTVGTTVLTLDVVPFTIGQQITIYDDVNKEETMISAINTSAKTITVTALTKAYKKGAFINRSSAVVDVVAQQMKFGSWGTYTITANEVI